MQKQRNLFIGTIAFVIVTTLFWYLIYFNNLNNSLNEMTDSYKRIENENRRFTEIEKKLPTIEKEWNQLKNELTAMLDKIPTSGAYDDISKMLYSLIQQNKLVILTYNESVVAINEKEIVVPDTKERLVIEKYPIDIELRGSFLDFGNFLDQLPKDTAPIHFLVGRKDKTVPSHISKSWKKVMLNAMLTEYKDLGHLMHEEDPSVLSSILRSNTT